MNNYIKLLIILNVILIALSAYIVTNNVDSEHQQIVQTAPVSPEVGSEPQLSEPVPNAVAHTAAATLVDKSVNEVLPETAPASIKQISVNDAAISEEELKEIQEVHLEGRVYSEIPTELLPPAEDVKLHKELEALERAQKTN